MRQRACRVRQGARPLRPTRRELSGSASRIDSEFKTLREKADSVSRRHAGLQSASTSSVRTARLLHPRSGSVHSRAGDDWGTQHGSRQESRLPGTDDVVGFSAECRILGASEWTAVLIRWLLKFAVDFLRIPPALNDCLTAHSGKCYGPCPQNRLPQRMMNVSPGCWLPTP